MAWRLLQSTNARSKGGAMLHYALIFFVIALVAALLGFRGVAGLSAEFGWVFVVLAVVRAPLRLLPAPPVAFPQLADEPVLVARGYLPVVVRELPQRLRASPFTCSQRPFSTSQFM